MCKSRKWFSCWAWRRKNWIELNWVISLLPPSVQKSSIIRECLTSDNGHPLLPHSRFFSSSHSKPSTSRLKFQSLTSSHTGELRIWTVGSMLGWPRAWTKQLEMSQELSKKRASGTTPLLSSQRVIVVTLVFTQTPMCVSTVYSTFTSPVNKIV